ncbi:hypothetical protein RFI_07280 [Reticulomyxa filosa]|uniref:Uncharacterized protein n=1 Tax=Reticulomyxa filosa TaxID=46433 RepID=X6NV07_RETFI|nr:hypothetical protein RFI_07280 [Reticulomyxa filosa]|eukprot:ETO29841.1 hypothetical protein RFI_07280 [Reticulomyxa filosa]
MPGVCPAIILRFFAYIGLLLNLIVVKLLWNKPMQSLVNKARCQYYRSSSLKLIDRQKELLKKKLEEFEAPLLDNRPVISFSPGGTLWAYFIGVIAYLRDHFDIQDAMEEKQLRLCGISCGTSAVITIFFNLSVCQAFEFGMEWQKLFDSRLLKFCFLDTKQVMDMILRLFLKFGIDDKLLKAQSDSKTSPLLYFGVTKWNLCPWKFEFVLAHSFR